MSKENIAKFQEASAQRPELLERLKDAHTPEAIAAVAQAEGFDFTAKELTEDLKAPARTGKLPDEELDGVAGGVYDIDGSLLITTAYGCQYWEPSTNPWGAVKGQCGSCKYGMGTAILGHCKNENNLDDYQ